MKMHEMLVLTAAACMMALVSRSVLGQEVQPVADRVERPERVEQRGDVATMRATGRAGGRGVQLSDEDMQEVMAFMREHSPNRVKAMESLPEESSARRGVMAFVVARYRALQAVKDEDAQLYDLGVKQVEIEDDLYRLLASARTVGDREKMRDRIRTAVRPQVETNLAERKQRLSRLREALRREERKLDADRAQIDELTETRTNTLIQEGTAALRRDALRRGLREDARGEGRPAGATSRPVEK
jgi:hypothetical protein